jgi:outer membrane protein
MHTRMLLLLLFLLPGGAAAQTFRDALVSAYRSNSDLQGARAGLRATDEQVGQARAGWLPTIQLYGSGGQTGQTVSRPIFDSRTNSVSGGIQMQQPIYSGGRTPAQVAQAEATVLAGRADLLGTEQSVLLRAATAYQDVLRDRALLVVARDKENVTRQQYEQIGIRMRAGQLTQTDVDQANSRYLAARAETQTQEGQLEASVASYVAAVGAPPAELAPAPRPPGLPDTIATVQRLADTNSPVVIASAFRERAARAQIGVARADLLPSLSLSLNGGRDYGLTIPDQRSNTWGVTLNLTVPLYQGGLAIGRVRQAQEQAQQSRWDTVSSRRDAIENASRAFATWNGTTAAARISVLQVRIAQAAYDGVQAQAALGARSTFELLGQLESLYDARRAQIGLEHDAAVASYQLLVAIGRFTAEALGLPVDLYDPTVHSRAARRRGGLP